MAEKFPAGRGLILGLLVAALGLALVADVSRAGWKERRARKSQETSTAAQEQERPQPKAEQPRPRAEPERPRPQVARSESAATKAPSPEQVAAIGRAQRCWTELGYYKGEVDGKRGRATWSAFWHFKHDSSTNKLMYATHHAHVKPVIGKYLGKLCLTDGADQRKEINLVILNHVIECLHTRLCTLDANLQQVICQKPATAVGEAPGLVRRARGQ